MSPGPGPLPAGGSPCTAAATAIERLDRGGTVGSECRVAVGEGFAFDRPVGLVETTTARGEGVRGGAAVGGTGDGVGAAHTSEIASDGGRACVDPESPEPQTHPFRSPSPTLVDAAPEEDQLHPPCPSLRQYPQKSG
jgi:hypothetical protein